MIAYIDTSVLIRIVFSTKPVLAEWDEIIVGVTSTLTRVEAYRTLHRMEFERGFSKTRLDSAYRRVGNVLKNTYQYGINELTLRRAAEPLPLPLRALDAVHLATAIQYRDEQPADEPPIRIATHDRAFARVARRLGFLVMGTAPD